MQRKREAGGLIIGLFVAFSLGGASRSGRGFTHLIGFTLGILPRRCGQVGIPLSLGFAVIIASAIFDVDR
jgi:hypothetical protein